MIYGYARVSTRGQQRDGNGLEAQREMLYNAGAQEIFEDAMTGTKADRPQLNALINTLKEGDTVVCCKLDRIARSTIEGKKIVEAITNKNASLNILNMGIIDSTPIGKVVLTVFLAFAEFERDMIVLRTAEGKAIAKQNPNYKEGRPPKFSKQQQKHALDLLNAGNSLRQVSDLTGISKSTLSRLKRENKTKKMQTA